MNREEFRPAFEAWLKSASNIDHPNVSLRRWTLDDGSAGDYSNQWARAYFAGFCAMAEHVTRDAAVARSGMFAVEHVNRPLVDAGEIDEWQEFARGCIIAAIGLDGGEGYEPTKGEG